METLFDICHHGIMLICCSILYSVHTDTHFETLQVHLLKSHIHDSIQSTVTHEERDCHLFLHRVTLAYAYFTCTLAHWFILTWFD